MRNCFLCLATCVWLACTVVWGQGVRHDPSAERLRPGAFRYQTLVGGKESGQSQIQIRKLADSGNYRFANLVEGAFSQSWEAIVSPSFGPVSAKLIFGQGQAARTAFELAYAGGRVTGFAVPGKGESPQWRRPVDEAVAADTVDQRVDWAGVMARTEYVPGEQFAFHVYDPGSGNSRVLAEAGGGEVVTVPAGAFETVRVVYRIEKNRGTEAYEVFFTVQIPRFLVKEKFPNGAVTELLEIKP